MPRVSSQPGDAGLSGDQRTQAGPEAPPGIGGLVADLNPVQREAVLHEGGPLLVLAGAGSGKTRVLTHRVAVLLARGVPPHALLAVTFTNKAATEMRERIHALVGPRARGCWIGTFHAMCARILRQDGEAVGLPRDFAVFDDGDQLALVREVQADLQIDGEAYPPRQLLSAISRAKEELLTPAQFERTAEGAIERTVARVYHRYQQRLLAQHAADFDDLIFCTVRLLREHDPIRGYYQDRFRHVLVDEYQDINRCQYELVRLLTGQHRNLCVVGDDDQSVYGWRGANVEFILAFEDDYSDARILKLEQNYRSTQLILDAAYHVVRRNRGRREKRLWTEKPGGHAIVRYDGEDEVDEARWVAQVVDDAVGTEDGGRPVRYGDFACLYRTNAQSRVLEDAFKRRRIPYRIVGGVRFYDRREVRDLIAYLRLAQNPADGLALKRALSFPARGVGEKSLERLGAFAASAGITLFEAICRAGEVEGLTTRARNALSEFARAVAWVRSRREELPVTSLLRELLERSGYRRALTEEKTAENEERLANVEEFVNVAREFDEQLGAGLAVFLEQLALISDVDTMKAGEDCVVLMTLHAAKGLEFPRVFICGLEEDVFPHSRAQQSEAELQEERRLCYVGITRARQRLYLTRARRRSVWGQTRYQRASRFLAEIPAECYEQPPSLAPSGSTRRYQEVDGDTFVSRRPAPGPDAPGSRLAAAREAARPLPLGTFRPGDRVRHAHFGEGIVTRSDGSGDDEQVTAVFPRYGQKKLIAGYARLEKL